MRKSIIVAGMCVAMLAGCETTSQQSEDNLRAQHRAICTERGLERDSIEFANCMLELDAAASEQLNAAQRELKDIERQQQRIRDIQYNSRP